MSEQPEDEKTPPEQDDGVGDTDSTPESPAEPQPDAVPAAPPPAVVERVGDWHRVTYGSWQLSVGPDGLIMLPRHLHPREFADFVAAGAVAVDVGHEIIATNEKAGEMDSARRSPRHAIVTEGDPPEGTVRMPVKPTGQQLAAAIGRPKRRGTGTTGHGVTAAQEAHHQRAATRRAQPRGK